MSKATAGKQEVKQKLDESIRYCNSHRDNVQTLFDGIVDSLIHPDSMGEHWATRQIEMKSLFPIILIPETSGFIPSIKIKEDEMSLDPHEFLARWLTRWVCKYVSAWETLPSERIAAPKGAATDYALIKMVAPHAGSEDKAREWASFHNLFMSAENIGGNLLEEYIASRVEPYNWIWCRGEILTAVDFCNRDCTEFIQVKNKSNTENSSGKGFRVDHNAPSWFRMYAERKNGEIVTRWPELVEIIRRGAGCMSVKVPDDLLNEDDYLEFVESVSENNSRMITSEEKK